MKGKSVSAFYFMLEW